MQRKLNHFNFFLRLPSQKRKKIKIIKRSYGHVTNTSGCFNITINSSDLDSINRLLITGKIELKEAVRSAREVLVKLRIREGINEPPMAIDNFKILEKYFSEYKRERPNLVDADAAKNKFVRSLKVIGQ